MNIIRGATVPLVATAPLAATAPLGPPEILAWGPTFFENLKTATGAQGGQGSYATDLYH